MTVLAQVLFAPFRLVRHVHRLGGLIALVLVGMLLVVVFAAFTGDRDDSPRGSTGGTKGEPYGPRIGP